MANTLSQLDIVVPAKNEAGSLPDLIARVDVTLQKAGIAYRVILVDDHSSDNTHAVATSLARAYPITYMANPGQVGKAFSILAGVKLSSAPLIAMLDADLEYPPEMLPDMVALASNHGAVVANRIKTHPSVLRRLASKFNRFVFGRLLLGIDCDTQSGLKLFRREVFAHLDRTKIGAWSIDMPLLYTTLDLGWSIGKLDMKFTPRNAGVSKLRQEFFKAVREIGTSAVKLRTATKKSYLVAGVKGTSVGAGLVHNRKRYITHSLLPHHLSAINTTITWQKFAISLILGSLTAALIISAHGTLVVLVAILTIIYFLDVVFNFFLVFKSLHFPPELTFTPEQLANLDVKNLPRYTILCPLYKEAHVLPAFIEAIANLDWPKDKLEVLLLLEADDQTTIDAAKSMELPKYIKTLIVPHSFPKTKPKACNYGLAYATGELIVIYDAEDRPDPNQLKTAYLGFQNSKVSVACLQAKLNYYNPHQNLLTRLFTAEYSLWFDVVLPGLQSVNTAIPLGGTSNHFRTQVLRDLQGWDAFNVTEDCDLGARLFKSGFTTAIIDSTTLEEANSRWGNWFRQRSRWIKGYMQTYLVHNRRPLKFIRDHGIHAFIFQLVVGGKIAFMLINPLLWLATILYFSMRSIVGPAIESLYPSWVFYLAIVSLVFGNFLYMYYYMIGAAKRGHWEIVKFVFFIPLYWLAVSMAAIKAGSQLVFKPHYWEKTNHGLHLGQAAEKVIPARKSFSQRFSPQLAISGSFLVGATLFANFLNFVGSTFLARSTSISFGELGTLGFIVSITTISDVIFGAIRQSVTYKTAFLLGKHGRIIKNIWQLAYKYSLILGVGLSVVWFASVPFLAKFFQSSALPLLITAPVWTLTVITAINSGFLSGAHKFKIAAVFLIVEALAKLVVTVGMVYLGWAQLVYLAFPVSLAVSAICSSVYILTLKKQVEDESLPDSKKIPAQFFFSSLGLRASGVLFLSVDVIVAKHLLSPDIAGQYVLLSTIGKMVYFFGSVFVAFISPLVSKNEGAAKSSTRVFNNGLALTALANCIPIVLVGILGSFVVPLLFSTKSLAVVSFLLPYTLAMSFFSVAGVITSYHQAKRHYIFSVLSLVLAIFQTVVLITSAQSIAEFTAVIVGVSAAHLIGLILLHVFYDTLIGLYQNLLDIPALFRPLAPAAPLGFGKKRILVLNWRDTKHVWGGGAEVYVHELAKRWVADGNQVTLFCGNDGHNVRNEVIDGVQIVRRGGFFTVYVWAFIYYIFKFKKTFDLVIDSENGVPFFAKLYSGVPTYLLIYHVHQEVFKKYLSLPLSVVASFMESKMIPAIYGQSKVITISESTKSDIIRMNLAREENILVIYPGIDADKFVPTTKTKHPSFIYLGRLKPYKNVDVALKAFATVHAAHPEARFTVAGEGESKESLISLSRQLGLDSAVKFTGKVSEDEKSALFGSHWAAVQPSSVEGWGITVIEANACGTPVVASNVPGLRDSVRNPHTGFLVACGDETGFAESIMRLVEDKAKRVRMSKYAISWAKRFGWDESAKLFMEALVV